MRFLREWVLKNWSLKLLALAISFLLWTTYTAEPFSEVGYLVPVEFRNVPPNLEISGDVPTQVHLRVRGRSGLLRRLTPADLSLAVDLSSLPAGATLVHLAPDQVTVPYGATVVSIAPSEVRVRLVPRRTAPPSSP